jgi:hypothetical protein
MSDNWLIVLPIDPMAKPSEERGKATFELLCALRPDAQDPDLQMYDTPEFIHCGSNFEDVFCPFCKTDIMDWWKKAMDDLWNSDDRRALSAETPCCGRATSLNDLDYDSPQGFACFAIELMNPSSDLEPEELQRVESTLGMPVRIIWRHI